MNDTLTRILNIKKFDTGKFAADRVAIINSRPLGISVSSPRPGKVSTIWSIVQKVCSRRRTDRSFLSKLVSAKLPVRSCKNIRSM
jgi:hypothetical protein